MKAETPIQVNRQRRNQPPGGRWHDLDPVTKGRVLMLKVSDAGCQAAALSARIRELKRLGDCAWRDFTLVARTRRVLEPIRAVLEEQGIPVARQGEPLPLHRIREVHRFLAELKARDRETLDLEALSELLTEQDSGWNALLRALLDDWRAEAGKHPVAANRIAEHFYEALAEQRREQTLGAGVSQTTLHGAKGLEFPHVLIADGGWSHTPESADEERRVFYVGMTRARETLTLIEIDRSNNPHLPLLHGDWLMRSTPQVEPPETRLLARRFHQLTLKDLDLDFAGRQDSNAAIHGDLARLSTGASLQLIERSGNILLADAQDRDVAKLSASAAREWAPKLSRSQHVKVIAMLIRNRTQSQPEFAKRCKTEQWELPVVEIETLETDTAGPAVSCIPD